MPKTEDELQHWVVEHNLHTTHDRTITSSYGYNRILDVDLVALCAELATRFEPPIRILDIGCGDGTALNQLSELLERKGHNSKDFEFWGVGLNRYEQMVIPDDRLIVDGLYAHDFQGMQFHLMVSVFAIHYMWHKLEAIEKIHNQLLFDGGQAVLHFPGYLARFGESPQALGQTEVEGNKIFQGYLTKLANADTNTALEYKLVPSYSDDDDCVLLAEFGNLRFQKQPKAKVEFGKPLEAFTMFDTGFAFRHMNDSDRVYVASHYECQNIPDSLKCSKEAISPATSDLRLNGPPTTTAGLASKPYRIVSLPLEMEHKTFDLDIAIHPNPSNNVLLISPGAYEPLLGRVVAYERLATAFAESHLGAVFRYNDPYDDECNYQEFLLAKTRRMIEYALAEASHYCATDDPQLKIMAYSSSAGAVAALASEYPNVDSLLLIAPSFDLHHDRVLPSYGNFTGDVKIMIGDSDSVVLPQQAFWYYENATSAASREYTEVPSCGHQFEGKRNKELFCKSAFWAFGASRPTDFPHPLSSPTEPWL